MPKAGWLAALAAVAGALAPAVAQGDAVADFYRGRTVNILLGTGPGATYDLYARVLATHMGRHIPGQPAMTVQYMPGAGGLKATNYLYNAAPKDGATIATLFGSLPQLQMLRPEAAKYDALKFSWLGAFSDNVSVVIVNSNAPALSFADATKKEVVIGSIGKGNETYGFPALLNSALGTKFRIISGYPSGAEIYKAMESGEVHGYAPVWLSIVTGKAAWLKEKKIAVLVQGGLTKSPDLPDVPLALDLAKTDEEKALLRFSAAATPIGRAALGPPDLPADRRAALEKAFADTVRDPAYIADANSKKLTVTPMSKDQIVAAVRQIVQTTPALLAKLKVALGY